MLHKAIWFALVAFGAIPRIWHVIHDFEFEGKDKGFMKFDYPMQRQFTLLKHFCSTILAAVPIYAMTIAQERYAARYPFIMNGIIAALTLLSVAILKAYKVPSTRGKKLIIVAVLMIFMNFERTDGYQPHHIHPILSYFTPTSFVLNILWATNAEMESSLKHRDISGFLNAMGGVIFMIIFCYFYETYEIRDDGAHSMSFHPNQNLHVFLISLYSFWNFCFAFSMHSHESGPFAHTIHLIVPLIATYDRPESWLYARIMAFGFFCFLKALGRYKNLWNNMIAFDVEGFQSNSEVKYVFHLATFAIALTCLVFAFMNDPEESVNVVVDKVVEDEWTMKKAIGGYFNLINAEECCSC